MGTVQCITLILKVLITSPNGLLRQQSGSCQIKSVRVVHKKSRILQLIYVQRVGKKMSSSSCLSPSFYFFQGLNIAGFEAIDIIADNALSHYHLSECPKRAIDTPPRMPKRDTLRDLDSENEFEIGKAKFVKLRYSMPLNHCRWDSASRPLPLSTGSRKAHSNGDVAPIMMRRTREAI